MVLHHVWEKMASKFESYINVGGQCCSNHQAALLMACVCILHNGWQSCHAWILRPACRGLDHGSLRCIMRQLGTLVRLRVYCRMILPEWLPPSYRGVSARFGHVLKATVNFSGSPAALQQLTKHLSLKDSRLGGGGSLLRLETNPSRARSVAQSKEGSTDKPPELTAVAKVPLLILPNQAQFSSCLLVKWPNSHILCKELWHFARPLNHK